MAYKNTALTAYKRGAGDVSDGRGRADLARDLTAAIATPGRPAADSQTPAPTLSLTALSGDLRAMRTDVQAGRVVPCGLLLPLNRQTGAADAACGTVHV